MYCKEREREREYGTSKGWSKFNKKMKQGISYKLIFWKAAIIAKRFALNQ